MQLARGLALELAADGVTVNLVAPGTIETDLNRAALGDPAHRARKLDLVPMRRIGTPADVAAAIGPDDSVEAHAADTIDAGAGSCAPDAVAAVCGDAPRTIAALEGGLLSTSGAALASLGSSSRRRVLAWLR